MEDQQSSGAPVVPLVIDRLRAAGLSEDRIQKYSLAGAIRLDGEPVSDLEQPAPPPARLVIAPS